MTSKLLSENEQAEVRAQFDSEIGIDVHHECEQLAGADFGNDLWESDCSHEA